MCHIQWTNIFNKIDLICRLPCKVHYAICYMHNAYSVIDLIREMKFHGLFSNLNCYTYRIHTLYS